VSITAFASDTPKTRPRALPEIKVGLFPGGGGTQTAAAACCSRRTRMQISVKGRPDQSREARAQNIAGAVSPRRFDPDRKGLIKGGARRVRAMGREGLQAARRPGLFQERMMIFPRQCDLSPRNHRQLSRARAIMQCAYEGCNWPMDAALRVESRYFAPHLQTKEAAARIRSLFLSMQELNKARAVPPDVPPTKVKKLANHRRRFLMGASVGYVSARAGIDVVLIDRGPGESRQGQGLGVIRDQKSADERIDPATALALVGALLVAVDSTTSDARTRRDIADRGAHKTGPIMASFLTLVGGTSGGRRAPFVQFLHRQEQAADHRGCFLGLQDVREVTRLHAQRPRHRQLQALIGALHDRARAG